MFLKITFFINCFYAEILEKQNNKSTYEFINLIYIEETSNDHLDEDLFHFFSRLKSVVCIGQTFLEAFEKKLL